MLKLLHISDLHFGPPYLPHVGEAVQRFARQLSPDLVIASGDFTQRGTRGAVRSGTTVTRSAPDRTSGPGAG